MRVRRTNTCGFGWRRVEDQRQRQDFGFLVLSPAGRPEAALPIAASRAGAVGVLDLQWCRAPEQAAVELDRLLRLGRGRLGVLLEGDDAALLDLVLARANHGLHLVVLAASDSDLVAGLPQTIERLHAAELRVFAQVTSLAAAQAALAAGADALIAKGHEAGGLVGDASAFVLLQQLVMAQLDCPIWVHGGLGPHTVAAAALAGAAGGVLDAQVLLARESPLPEPVRAQLRRVDGSETAIFGGAGWGQFRAYVRPGLGAVDAARRHELGARLLGHDDPPQRARAWRQHLRALVGWQDLDQQLLALGQDAAFGPRLVGTRGTVGDVLQRLRGALEAHLDAARRLQPLAEGAGVASAHGTRYPIVQGPMTRVSDSPAFAAAVAEAGALPFLALALMRGPEVEALLHQAQTQLGSRAWGVGILGFVPPAVRAEQLEVIERLRPPFALIAGGRPDQTKHLEQLGIPTYLHVPSPGLLEMFLGDGARRFVFEGRECGGHVGPRTSFVLWDTMVQVLLEAIHARTVDATDLQVLFAGGVHDGLSAAMVSAIAAP